MLKNISPIIPPDLLKVLMEMGHGDEIVVGDGNFPAASTAKTARASLVRCDGHNVPEILEAVMQLFPLDKYVAQPAFLMEVVDSKRVPSSPYPPPRWLEYKEIIQRYEPEFRSFKKLERFAFYEQANRCYAVVATGEKEIYANIILKKGVL